MGRSRLTTLCSTKPLVIADRFSAATPIDRRVLPYKTAGASLAPALLALLVHAGSATSMAAQELPEQPPRAEELPEQPAEAAYEEPPRPAFDFNVLDPRIGLKAGWTDAESAIWNLAHVASLPRAEGFFNPDTPGDGAFSNTDLAFQGDLFFQGNYNGFQIYDISDPTDPRLRVAVVCPGGQGDVSVYGDLLFMSAQETRGRLDCGTQGVQDTVSVERFRGVRIFDISNLDDVRQLAAVQSCRGSHTHTLVKDPDDDENLYVYIQGTSDVRPGEELEGCSGLSPDEDPNTALFRIEVIQVPLAAPEEARIVSMPRLFADPATGNIAGLWEGGDHGEGTQQTSETNRCHDITVYPELGLAGGACSGNGLLLDISDPVNPVRIDEVVDPNFAYWHSATFNNDGTKILFTDEWGGGGAARCRASDPKDWGANAIFEIEDGMMELAGYYKLPVPQTEMENCVAHNGSLIPVPGRDIFVQAWYQGGLSMLDFTDASNPIEIGFFDRGPLSDTVMHTGGYWSTYWNNGHIYGAEISRGIDVFRLTPSEFLSQNEIDAAGLVQVEAFNAQMQPRFVWPASVVVARAYMDQLERGRGIQPRLAERVTDVLERADMTESAAVGAELEEVASSLEENAAMVDMGDQLGDARRQRLLATTLRDLAATMH